MPNGNLLKEGFSNFNQPDADPVNQGMTTPVEQSFVEGIMGLGWSLIGSGLAKQFDNPQLMKAAEATGKTVTTALKNEWYQTQAENFMNTHGKQYQEQLQMAQKQHRLATTAQRSVDPNTGEETMAYLEYDADGMPTGAQILSTDYEAVTSHLLKEKERFFSNAHNLSTSFMNAAGKYQGNPLIAGMVEKNISFWQDHATRLSSARKEALAEAESVEARGRRAEKDDEDLLRAGTVLSLLANENNKDPLLVGARKFLEEQGLLDDSDTGRTMTFKDVMNDPLQAKRILDAFDTYTDVEQRRLTTEKTVAETRLLEARREAQLATAMDARARARARTEKEKWGAWDPNFQILNLRSLTPNQEGYATLIEKKRVQASDFYSDQLVKIESAGKRKGPEMVKPERRAVIEQYLDQLGVEEDKMKLRQQYADYFADQDIKETDPEFIKEGAVLWMMESAKGREQLRELHDMHPEWGEYTGNKDTKEYVEWVYDRMYPAPMELLTPTTRAREAAPQTAVPTPEEGRAALPARERGGSIVRDIERARGFLGGIRYPQASPLGELQRRR